MGIFTKKKEEDKKVSKKDDTKKVEKSAKIDSANNEKNTVVSSEPKKESIKELYSEDKKKATSKKETKTDKKKYGNAYRILVKPLITEKASDIGVMNKYIFEVSRDANKIEVAKAIKEVYGIKPTSVNILKVKGKKVRSGRIMGKKKDWKKAIVTLGKGETIKVYEGV